MSAKEPELLTKCAQGNEKAFVELYHLYAPLVFRFIYSFVKSSELADDLRQEVFIKVWEQRQLLGEIQSFKAYLFTVSRNHTLNALKKASKEQAAMGFILNNYQEQSDPEDERSAKEYLAYLDQVISKISPQSRNVFMLCRQQNKSYDEVADLLGISRNAVKKHMVKSMKILSEAVKKDLGLPLSVALVIFLNG